MQIDDALAVETCTQLAPASYVKIVEPASGQIDSLSQCRRSRRLADAISTAAQIRRNAEAGLRLPDRRELDGEP